MPSEFSIRVKDCPECHGDHGLVNLAPLARPYTQEGLRFTHGYTCPVRGVQVEFADASGGLPN